MDIVDQIPADLCKWRMARATLADGRVRMLTGHVPEKGGQHAIAEVVRQGGRVDLVPRVIVRAALRPDGFNLHLHVMRDCDDLGANILMNSSGMQDAVHMMMNGTMPVRDGYMQGLWTFKSQSGTITIRPLLPADHIAGLGVDAAGVPDLTAMLMGMQRAA